MALVVYTILRSSGGNSWNGMTSFHDVSHEPIIAGYCSRHRWANSANNASAAGNDGAV